MRMAWRVMLQLMLVVGIGDLDWMLVLGARRECALGDPDQPAVARARAGPAAVITGISPEKLGRARYAGNRVSEPGFLSLSRVCLRARPAGTDGRSHDQP